MAESTNSILYLNSKSSLEALQLGESTRRLKNEIEEEDPLFSNVPWMLNYVFLLFNTIVAKSCQ